ncbi:unnamed protein product [Mytilus edulis]|uniref:Ig-like domain-containing protein n=1 Tax=Mytilus edulis TaxID=6550 RepID=A0A8S3QR89_MYTED|nr:unnamed protein product [Mytilus edulis]
MKPTTSLTVPKGKQGNKEQNYVLLLILIPVVLIGGSFIIVGLLARVKGITIEQDNTVENQLYQNSNVPPMEIHPYRMQIKKMNLRHNFRFMLYCVILSVTVIADVSLRSEKDVITFGGAIILTCVVNGISTIDSDVTRQWSMGNDDQLLSYNGRINNRRKYEETVLTGNGFSLKIFNITEADVNVTYRCRYGFETTTHVIKITDDNYIYPPTPESTIVTYFMEKQMETVDISIYFEKVFPLPNCSLNVDKRVACNRFINISPPCAENQYDIGAFQLKDECSIKGTSSSQSILTITLIPTGCLVLIIVLVTAICLVLQKTKKTRKGEYYTTAV